MTPLLKTGIFCGSFNPIHIGHLALANYLCEYEDLNEVWFVITPHNPLKQSSELWPDSFRLELAQIATADYPKFHASDFEFHLPRPSYTAHTLEKLRESHPNREFHLIIGSDNWMLFDRWVRHDEIIAHHPILVYPRPGYQVDTTKLPSNVKLTDAPTFEISSTFIRQALHNHKDIRYFLYPDVYKRIIDSELF